jgi:hydrogenase nickel incorporation protein HypB
MCDVCGCHDEGSRRLAVERDLLAANDGVAAANRALFAARGVLALNLVSSPGAGKTTLLERTVAEMAGELPVCVIEGDQQTDNDAARIRRAGARAVQVNTGSGCHLDARMVARAVAGLDPGPGCVLFIENVGNLVCPAMFDLGESAKVAIVSVTEGEDKPEKYPYMFRAASLCIVNKTDLVPHLGCDLARLRESARAVNPALDLIELSARTGEGVDRWLDWIRARRKGVGKP